MTHYISIHFKDGSRKDATPFQASMSKAAEIVSMARTKFPGAHIEHVIG